MSYLEVEILRICESYKDFVFKKDYAALSALYHEDILAFDLWGKGIYESRGDWSNNLKNWLTSLGDELVEVSFESVKADAGESVAFAHAQVTYKAVDKNGRELRKMKNRLSWGLIKSEHGWLIVHQHTSVPIEFETTKAIFFS